MKPTKQEKEDKFMSALFDSEYWQPNVTKISKYTQIPISTVWDKVRRLIAQGKIEIIVRELTHKEITEKGETNGQ